MIPVTLIPGDGIGPEISQAVVRVVESLPGLHIKWDPYLAGEAAHKEYGTPLPEMTIDSFQRIRVCLKGPLTTPIGEGFQSVNVELRRRFDLFANVRPAKSFDGVKTRYENVDLVIVRENTEGEYSGIEHYIDNAETIAEAISVTTLKGCLRIVNHAIDLAHERRNKLTLVHKANILKKTSGMFLRMGRIAVNMYNTGPLGPLEFSDLIVDNAAMQLVRDPTRFDVIVTTNLFGDILSDLTAGLVGGLGLVGSANYGISSAMFEAVHGSAPDIAGKGIANPTGLMMAATMMLRYLEKTAAADTMEQAIRAVIAEGKHTTGDIGGSSSTVEFTDAVIDRIKHGT